MLIINYRYFIGKYFASSKRNIHVFFYYFFQSKYNRNINA